MLTIIKCQHAKSLILHVSMQNDEHAKRIDMHVDEAYRACCWFGHTCCNVRERDLSRSLDSAPMVCSWGGEGELGALCASGRRLQHGCFQRWIYYGHLFAQREALLLRGSPSVAIITSLSRTDDCPLNP